MSKFKSSRSVAYRKPIVLDSNDPKSLGQNLENFKSKAGAKVIVRNSTNTDLELTTFVESPDPTLYFFRPIMHEELGSSETTTVWDPTNTPPGDIKYSIANNGTHLFVGLKEVFGIIDIVNKTYSTYVSDLLISDWKMSNSIDNDVTASFSYSDEYYNLGIYCYKQKYMTSSYYLSVPNGNNYTIAANINSENYISIGNETGSNIALANNGAGLNWQKVINVEASSNSCVDFKENVYFGNSDARSFNLICLDRVGNIVFSNNYDFGQSSQTGEVISIGSRKNSFGNVEIVIASNINNTDGIISVIDNYGNIILSKKINNLKITDMSCTNESILIIGGRSSDNVAILFSPGLVVLDSMSTNQNFKSSTSPAACSLRGSNIYINYPSLIMAISNGFKNYENTIYGIIISKSIEYSISESTVIKTEIFPTIEDSSDIIIGTSSALFGSGI